MKIKLLKEDEKWYRAVGRLAWNLLIVAACILIFYLLESFLFKAGHMTVPYEEGNWSHERGFGLNLFLTNVIPYCFPLMLVLMFTKGNYPWVLYFLLGIGVMLYFYWKALYVSDSPAFDFIFVVIALPIVTLLGTCFVMKAREKLEQLKNRKGQ